MSLFSLSYRVSLSLQPLETVEDANEAHSINESITS